MEKRFALIFKEHVQMVDVVMLRKEEDRELIILLTANDFSRGVRRFCNDNKILILNLKKVRARELL